MYRQLLSVMGSNDLGLLFDPLSMANVGIWDTRKRRTAYTGYAFRAGLAADSGATTLDIGFTSAGVVDMTDYAAFGTGAEKIVTWYDQSGNGFDLTRSWSATLCPILRTSTYNDKPCVYFTAGSLGNSGFTNWNGLADANFYFARKAVTLANGFMMAGGSTARYIYAAGGVSNRDLRFDTSSGVESSYYQNARNAGALDRFQFDGGAATDALKARLFENGVEDARDANSGTHGTTLANETGIYFNGESSGNNGLINEYFAIYYLGRDTTGAEDSAIQSTLNADYFTLNKSQLICVGDSLTLGIGVASPGSGMPPADADIYVNQLTVLLEAETGTEWIADNIASESAAKTERVLQMMEGSSGPLDRIDTHYDNTIVCAWAGTNDFAIDLDTVADVKTGCVNIATPAQARGADVYFGNMIVRTDLGAGNGAFETKRGTYNSEIAASLSGIAEVVPLASRTELDDSTDSTYFDSDLVHLKPAGYTAVADTFFDSIQPNLN